MRTISMYIYKDDNKSEDFQKQCQTCIKFYNLFSIPFSRETAVEA